MAKRELLVTLGLDATTYAQEIRRANQLNKELDNAFKLLSSSSEGFEKTLEGLGKKQDYLGKKMKVATELSDVYTKRINESKQALDETIEKSEQYKKTLDALNKKKEEGAELTNQEKKLLKETQQLYDKAQKSIVTYNTRISEGVQGYEKTQTALQGIGRELAKTIELEKTMSKDFFLDEMREEISKADQEFKLLANSTENFSKTFEGLVATQKHFENQSQNVNKLMDGLQQEIEGSNKELMVYKERISDVNKLLREWEDLLDSTDKADESYDEIAKEVEKLRQEYSELNAVAEVHEDRVKQLSDEYKRSENAIVSMGAKIGSTKEKIQELTKAFEFDKVDTSVKKLANGSIEKLQQELDQLEDDFINVTNEVKDYENSLTGLNYKQEYLNKSLDKSKDILSQYKNEMEQSVSTSRKYRDNLRYLEQQLEKNAQIGKEMLANGDGAGADKQVQIMKDLKEQIDKVNKEYQEHEKKVKETESAYKNLKQEISGMKGDLVETANSAEKLNRSLNAEKLEREISKITSKFDLFESELRKSVSSLEGMDMIFKRIGLESDHLSKKIDNGKSALSAYENSIKNTSSTLTQLEDKYKSLNKELEEHKSKLKNLDMGDAGYNETIIQVTRLESAINELDGEIDQHEQELLGLKTAHNNLQAEINETIREQQQLKSTMTGDFLEGFGNQLQEVGGVLQSAGMALMPLTLAIGAIGGASIKTGTEFYQSMSKVQAISKATSSELEQLTSKAREMGATTIWSSRDSAEALNFMALAGWNTTEMMSGLPAILNLASAGGTDLALTSDIVTDGLTAMRMSAEDAGKYADIMAQTMSNSNTTIELMGDTMKYAGAVAGGLGISMEDLSLAIGIMANSGIKGSMSGTALRAGLTRLIAPTDKAKALMEEYGISVQKTADGNVDLRATMENLQEKLGGLSSDTQNMIAKTIFGQTAMNGWLTIINADKDAFNDLALAIDTSAGSAERMAETMTDNLWGDLKELSSAVEESLISIFDAIEPMLRSFIQTITNIVLNLTKMFNSLSPSMQKLIVIFTALTALGAPLLIMFGALMNAIGGIASGVGTLMKGFGKVKTMFTGLDGVVSPFVSKIALLGKRMLMLSGIAGAVAIAFGIFYTSMQKDAIESVDVITESMSDAGKALAEPFIDAKTEIDSVMLQMSNSNVAVTKDMVSQMETSLGNMADNTVAVLEKSQSTVKNVLSKNMKELADANEEQISSMKTKVDEIYESKINIVREKEKAVLDIQKKAQEEGRGLFVRERNEMDNLLKEIQTLSINAMGTMNTELADLESKMLKNRDAMNAESIGNAVKQAQEKRDKIVEQSQKEYDQLVNIQRMLKDDLTDEENSKLEEMVGLAKLRKDNLTQIANDEYSSLISTARKLAGDTVDQIDWATGEVKTKWEVMVSSLGNSFKKIGYDLGLEVTQWTTVFRKFGMDMEILSLKAQKLWSNKEKDKELDKQIAKIEKQKDKLVEVQDEVIKVIDTIQDLSPEFSVMAKELDSALSSGLGESIMEFALDINGNLTKAKEDFYSLPPSVQSALMEYDKKLIQAGVSGGMKQFIQFIRGDIDTLKMEFEDLPESVQGTVKLMEMYFDQSAEKINGISFGEFVQSTKQDMALVGETFANLPPEIQKAIKSIPKDEWSTIMQYYKMTSIEELADIPKEFQETGKESGEKFKEGVESTKEESKNAGKELADATNEGVKTTTESSKQAGAETGNAYKEGVESAKETLSTTGKDLGNATNEGFKGGLQDLPQALKDKLADAGVIVQQDGGLIVQDFEKTGRDAVTGFVNELNSQLPQLDDVTIQISDRLGGIDNVRLGNVTKQLSEVNRWLGVVQQKAVITHGTMALLTKLSWGNTTKGLSEVNNWLMRTSNRSKDARSAMVQLTNLPFGNTTKGLSEVNNWLMRTTNRSKDTQKALKSITEVTFGVTTKGLSEVNKWLTTVKTSSNSAKTALSNITNVKFGGVTKGLSEVNKWLNTVKNTASGTKSALYAVAKAQANGRALTAPPTNLTPDSTMPQVPSALTRDSWLDFGDITKYKTGGGFYNPTSMATQSNIQKETKNDEDNKVLKTLIEQNQLLIQLLTADRSINVGVQVDGRQIAKASARYIEEEMNTLKSRSNRLGGKLSV